MRKQEKRKPLYDPAVFWSNVQIASPNECWPWLRSRLLSGYGRIWDGDKYTYTHRHAYQLTHGAIPDGLHVCHTCDNRICCNPAHLWVGTNADNMHDRDTKGRGYFQRLAAERRANAKEIPPRQPRPEGWKRRHMSPADAMAIRQSYAQGTPAQELAEQHQKSVKYIRGIIRGAKWKHLPVVEVLP